MASFSKAIQMKDVCNITTEMSILSALVKNVGVTFKHLCESWKDSKTFQGLAALFHTPLPFMVRTTASNLSLTLLDQSEQTSQTSMSRHYIISNDSNFINYVPNWWLMVDLMPSDKTHSGNVQFTIFIFCRSIHLSAGSCKPNTLIYLRERDFMMPGQVCVWFTTASN